MTGTGTQQDPFKPTSWPELLSVSTSNTVFIELPQGGGTFNMNDYYPEGIVQTIILKGNINGNGWTIKNPDYMGSNGCFDIGNAKKTELHFINCKGKLSANYFIGTNDSISSGAVIFDQCQFSGKIESISNTTPAFSNLGRQAYYKRCSLNIELVGAILDYALFRYCMINAKITRKEGASSPQGSGYLQLDNTYLTGEIESLQMQRYSSDYYVGDSIIDCNILSSIRYDTSDTPPHILINSEKVTAGVSIPSVFTQVSTAQLKDANYLSSLRFPIQTYLRLIRRKAKA